MKNLHLILSIFAAFIFVFSASAQEQQEPDTDKIIAQQVEKLEKLLDLDDIQIFYVDSILQTNINGMFEEIESLKKGGSEFQESYIAASDKWLDKTDDAFQSILSEEQWKKYMKSNYGKEKIKREKRNAKRTSSK